MQIIFIHHSCFLVELDDKVLIFDYFDGDKVEGMHFTGKLPSYEPDTKIYMFASHSHKDHYDMDILRLADKYPNIHYVFSKDIRISPHFLSKHGIDPTVRDRVTFVSPDNTYHVDDLDIMTLRSTDAGVAFYVASNGVSLFHAGDLNDWEWDGAGDLINGRVRRAFRHEIKKLSEKPINVAFSRWIQSLWSISSRVLIIFYKIPRQSLFSLCICGRTTAVSLNTRRDSAIRTRLTGLLRLNVKSDVCFWRELLNYFTNSFIIN